MNYLYELSEKEIILAFKERNTAKIKKETNGILNQLIVFMMNRFEEQLKGITFDIDWNLINETYITSEENRKAMLKWLQRMKEMDFFFLI